MKSTFTLEQLSNWLYENGVYADFKMFPANDEDSEDETTYVSIDESNIAYSPRDVHYDVN